MERRGEEEELASAMNRIALLLHGEEEVHEETKKEQERVQEGTRRKKKSSLYSNLSKVQSFEGARQVGAATLEDYDRDREAEEERVRLLLQGENNELSSSTEEVPTVSSGTLEEIHKELSNSSSGAANQKPVSEQVLANQMSPLNQHSAVKQIPVSQQVVTNRIPTVNQDSTANQTFVPQQILTNQKYQYFQDSTANPPILHQVFTNQMPPSQQANQTTTHNRKVVRRKPQSHKTSTANQTSVPLPVLPNQTSAPLPVLANQTTVSHQAYSPNLPNVPHHVLTNQMLASHPAVTANQTPFPRVGNQRPDFNSMGTPVHFEPQVGTEILEFKTIMTRHQCVTAMPVYENKSFEELRLEDYYVRRCGPTQSPVMMPAVMGAGHANLPWGKTQTYMAFGGSNCIGTTLRKSVIPAQEILPIICDLDLVQKCKDPKCPRLHHPITSLPYQWQVKLYDCWFDIVEMEQVEKAFCDKKLEVLLLVDSPEFSGRLNLQFKGNTVTGRCIDQGAQIEARRLSTISYTQAEQGGNSFMTQWRWYWHEDDRQYQLYTKEHLQYTLETKYLAGQKEYIFSLSSTEYKISFTAMTQTNKLSNMSRPIIRRPLLVTAQDVTNSKLPPSVPLPPLIQVILPKDWAPWDHSADYELVQLTTDCDEYEEVTSRFFATLSPSVKQIQSVFRVQCPVMWMAFISKEHCMEVALQRAPQRQTDVNRQLLFHGTDTFEAVQGILTNNFDNRVSGKNATAFGDGVYFAKKASYSDRYTKGVDKYMFLAAVLVGQSAKGEASLRRPPVIPNSRHVLYDSCVDNVKDPSIFVLFEKSQHYPAYLIHYKNK